MRDDYLYIYAKAQGMKRKWGNGWAYDYSRLWKEIPELQKYKISELPRFLFKMERAIRKNYLRIIEPNKHYPGYLRKKELFGNIIGKRGFNALIEEIHRLQIFGEPFEKSSRGLQRRYHAKTRDLRDPWDWEAKKLEKWTSEDIKAEKKILGPFYAVS